MHDVPRLWLGLTSSCWRNNSPRNSLAERTVDVPPSLAGALAADATLQRAWDALSYTRRKELARGIAEARQEATRERRLAKALEELQDLS